MKKRIFTALAVAAAVAVALAFTHLPRAEAVTDTDAKAGAYTMEQTLTAAGQIEAASTEEIAFSTSKAFAGMCVEEGDAVRQGQHLISYSDGTYEDAPDDGVVISVDAPDTGAAGDEDNRLTLAYTDRMILEVSIPEDEIGKLSKGDEAEITVNADTGKTFNGTVTSIKALSTDLMVSGEDTSADGEGAQEKEDPGSTNESVSESGSTAYYTAAMLLTNDGTLKPGMSAGCTVTISRRSVLAVPVEAVRFDENDVPFVEILSGNSVTAKEVATGESDANYVEITEGLSDGETVRMRAGE